MQPVKKFYLKTQLIFVSCVVSAALSTVARAEEPSATAILNANRVTELLHSVAPSLLHTMVAKVASGEAKRLAPSQPIWILNQIDGSILYYEGQPSFTGKAAAQLVDDNGFRFGQKALDNASKSKSGWVGLALNGQPYKAYCKAKYPTVVCSLVL